MSNLQNVLESLRVGDVIETRRTHKVTDVTSTHIRMQDVQNGEYRFVVYKDDDNGSLAASVVKKAPPKKYHLFDVVLGSEAENLPLHSVLRYTDAFGELIRTRAHGGWNTSTGRYVGPLSPGCEYEILYVPTAA